MSAGARALTRILSVLVGLAMTAAAGILADGPALVLVGLAILAVLAGIQFRTAATLAVLLVVSAFLVADSPPVFAALAGLLATVYLVLRHGDAVPGLFTLTQPTIIGAVAFTLAGLVATEFPLELAWLPLLAPLSVFGIYALATRPYWMKQSGAHSAERSE